MNIGRVGAVEQKKKPAVFIMPVPVKLDKKSMCLRAGNIIVMETDPLARDEFVCRYVETITQSYFKQLFHLYFNCR